MPLRGKSDPPPNQPLYYRSLQEFDSWAPVGDYDGIVKFKSRKTDQKSANKGKLLVCHDYKGGYTESSFARSYTFNFWSSTDIFIYFSHHRITIPPPGWISASHRQGVKMLGTLIFEGGAEGECLRLIVGKIPASKTGQVDAPSGSFTLPLSPFYARRLAELARERGFDGYLLNFECPLSGSFEQTRALAAWITLLQSEILDKVGPHGETIWYDSVIINGKLAWQDRLNSYNLPFFLSSTGFFSNYTWRNNYPSLTAQYFLSLDQRLTGDTPETSSQLFQKTLQHIYIGIDVWGRGCHGGGGFGSFRALDHISPESLGLSVAVFGQAWTWESEQDKDGWNWDSWWEYDSKLWVGPASGSLDVPLPEMKWKTGEQICEHENFTPITAHFPQHPPPDPADVRFHTTFCPGTGLRWFVEGAKVFESTSGWTDVDKQTSVGDMLWPRPKLYWEDKREDQIPTASAKFYMDDAWNGGNSLRITISSPGSKSEIGAYRSLWLPIQSFCFTPQRKYQASVVYKVNALAEGVDIEFALSLHTFPGAEEDFVCNVNSSSEQDLGNGWTKSIIDFNLSAKDGVHATLASRFCIGLVVAVVTETPAEPVEISFLLGQLNVFALLPPSFAEDEALLLWADYTPTTASSSSTLGILSWEVSSNFPDVKTVVISPEDPTPAWNVQPTIPWFPSLLYYNIYAQSFTDEHNIGKVDQAVWIGTSGAGWSGRKNVFTVLSENFAFEVPAGKLRFYVQGVTDLGEVMKWSRCTFVDVILSIK